MEQIAAVQNTTTQRIAELTKLAFLSPRITKQILQGEQPIALTTDYVLKRPLPNCWKAQEELFSQLS